MNTNKTPKTNNSNFFSSYLAQSNKEFQTSFARHQNEPAYFITRYLPRLEDLPLPPSSDSYTLARQTLNVIALATWFQSKQHFIAGLSLSLLLNVVLQHAIYPYFDDENDNGNAPQATM